MARKGFKPGFKPGYKRKRSTSKTSSSTHTRREESDVEPESEVQVDKQKKVRWENKPAVESAEEPESEHSESEEDHDHDQPATVCLAAYCLHGRIGCAYYDPVKFVVYVLEDTQENLHFDLTKMILEQASPDVTLTSSKADDTFIDTLREHMETSNGIFQIRPHKDFIPTKGRDRLLSLRLLSHLSLDDDVPETSVSDVGSTSEPRNAYDFMRRRRDLGGDPTMMRWNASIRLANYASLEAAPLCLASVGALLDYMTRERAVRELQGEGIGGLEVRAIEMLTLDQVMQINADALFSLQVFENESHASVHSDKTKEGLSLFGILNSTKTTLGRSLLRTWLLRPALSLPVINARHDSVACFLSPENLVTSDAMHSHLGGIKNVPRILGAMRTGKAKLSDWQGLVKFTFHSAMLRDALAELHQASGVEIVKKLVAALDIASFREVGSAVNDTIDWEESANAGRVCVRPHIDEELDNRKHVYHGIDGVLSKVAQQISPTVPPDYASSLNVVYFPQLGFLVCLPMLEEWKTEEGIKVIDGWSFQFSSESHVYFKSQEMHDMDTHIGDLHPAIVDREIEIVQALQENILQFDEAMGHACDVCAELDCLLSFAEASRAYDYRRPVMVEENIIEIVQGRHPLQEQVVDTFVPNDARLVGGMNGRQPFTQDDGDESESSRESQSNSMIICTGANACGKSVYLKQIALIQYMAQIGCFVPAESATLGVVDKIFTRIQTPESVSKVQSAFMIDLNQVSLALRNSTARSLILLDEFGKGTVSTDGAGLFCGVLKHLLDRGPACPKVLVATHFHDVFKRDLFDPQSVPVTFAHMQVMFTSDTGEVLDQSAGYEGNEHGEDDDDEGTKRVGPGETITYLYRVASGLSLNSNAARCAEIFGIPRRVVQRAEYVTHLLSNDELGQLLDEDMTAKEKLDLEDAEVVCRKYLAWNFQDENEDVNVRKRLAEVLGRAAVITA